MHLRSSLLFLLLSATSGIAQSPSGKRQTPAQLDALTVEPEIRSRVDAFFSVLKQRRVEDAYKRLLSGSVLAQENPEMVAKLIESTGRVLEMTGTLDGTELLKIRTAGKSLREVTYVLNGSKRPLRWTFYFYLAEGQWQVLDTNVAAEASGFFEPEK